MIPNEPLSGGGCRTQRQSCSALSWSTAQALAQGEGQSSYLGLEEREVSSTEKVKQCIFNFSCWYIFILNCAVLFPYSPTFLMDTACNYSTFESLYIILVLSEIGRAFVLFSASVAQFFCEVRFIKPSHMHWGLTGWAISIKRISKHIL